jgi:hypothetical protein
VLVNFRIFDTLETDIYSFECYDSTLGTWLDMNLTPDDDDLIAYWGPSGGFPMSKGYSATTECRVVFINPGSYDVHITVDDLATEPDLELAQLEKSVAVLGNFTVKGTVAMQGRTVRFGVPLTLTDIDGEPLYGPFDITSNSDLAYNALFTNVNGSVYKFTTLQPRYLNVYEGLDKMLLVKEDNTIIEALELKGGNAEWSDNVINLSDASMIGTYYGIGDITFDADVNFDDKVNIQDLALVGGNYTLTSEVAYADWTPEADETAPVMEDVLPTEGNVELGANETFVWTFDASDLGNNLYELEIDHNMEELPEFSVYASALNPYGTAADKAEFEAYGVSVTYDTAEQKWVIDFGDAVTDQLVSNGGITFYVVLKDRSGNQWGTMYGTTPENTFAYTITRAD